MAWLVFKPAFSGWPDQHLNHYTIHILIIRYHTFPFHVKDVDSILITRYCLDSQTEQKSGQDSLCFKPRDGKKEKGTFTFTEDSRKKG